jgi:hypothetical protein
MLRRGPILLALALALLAGCGSGRPERAVDPAASNAAPAGLAVRAEVHVRDTIAAARFRPGVYLLEPDGTLRVAERQPRVEGQPMPPQPNYPPILRRLPPSEVDRLWRLIGPTTLADPGNPERIGRSEDWAPARNRSVALIDIHDHNGARRFAISLTGATPTAIDGRALVERLQALAWRTPPPAAAPAGP